MTSVFRRSKKEDEVAEPVIVVEEPEQKKSKKEIKKEEKKLAKEAKKLEKEQEIQQEIDAKAAKKLAKEEKKLAKEAKKLAEPKSSFITSLFRKDTIDSIISTPEGIVEQIIDETIPDKTDAVEDLEKMFNATEITEEPKMNSLIINGDDQIIEDEKKVGLTKALDNEEIIMSNKTYNINVNLSNEEKDVTSICFKNDASDKTLLEFKFFKSKKEMKIFEHNNGIVRLKLKLALRYLDSVIIVKLGGVKIPITIKNTKTALFRRVDRTPINLATWTLTNCEFN